MMASQGSTRRGAGKAVALVVLVVCLLAMLALAYALIFRPPAARPLIDLIDPQAGHGALTQDEASGGSLFAGAGDRQASESELAAEQAEWKKSQQMPLIARCGKLDLRSCVTPKELTGILFHQASYNYALVLETELPEADYEKSAAEGMRINRDQDGGEWVDADALHLWRTSDTTDMDTSIDIGAAAGTVVRAPVTGTVVLVRDYMLYDEVPDVEIHIQPDGFPSYDCVLIHTTDPMVKAGDVVEAGLTEIAKVRDIEADLTDVQLSFFTPDGVGGNHVHVQVNDADYDGYRKEKLKGAYKVKSS